MHRNSYKWILISVLILGVLWVVITALLGKPEHGELGGALGVILSLVVISQKPKFGFALLDQLRKAENARQNLIKVSDETAVPELTKEELSKRAYATEAIFRNGNAIESENVRWLAGATAIATTFWGFGELMAETLVKIFS